MDRIHLKAYGKVNLALDVIGKRPNGYHDVRMIMQTVQLFDRLTMEKIKEDEIQLTTNLSYVPCNEQNLVYKAIALIKQEYGIKEGVRVHLDKHIPVSAGMAGGSSDCASALYGMNQLFALNLKIPKLMELGVQLGADVPYCLLRGTALSEGIGEILTRLPAIPDCYFVIAKPAISVSTRFVYEHLNLQEIEQHPDIDGMIEALKETDLQGVAKRLSNTLESVTIKQHPIIAKIKETMLEHGAMNALMSGSGPTVFGIYDNLDTAKHALFTIRRQRLVKQSYLVEPFNIRKAEYATDNERRKGKRYE
ncbi:MAG: 4-(cytidine 5'-diphospho)-2-C-methyl-D-erythritol kinase [Firmicutes bacterium]|uniref:4-diphosphocytidyl-2-C-methyl-D-erythritol kinase n=1 Tax=Candidatus Scybalomonas excrementavium TaxID=2840943 RepID=A0A9D9N6Z7_9FIRM|nr:4-(cytidine 5'-diphospho)-2-C-methyl-D-erythritol kinase [Candidatus Scybalomonas excrementavium]